MSKRKESGAQGRKRRKTEQEQLAKLTGSLDRFIVNTADSHSDESTPESVCPGNPLPVNCSPSALEAETALPEHASTSGQSSALSEHIDMKVFTDIGYWPENVAKTLEN